jgi:hypothetical protein
MKIVVKVGDLELTINDDENEPVKPKADSTTDSQPGTPEKLSIGFGVPVE